jgi:putative ABC transport system permease protein
MPTLRRDFLFGFRMLLRNPGFTAVALLTLALAIGANIAIFSVTSALLLRPFPYPKPKQLMAITMMDQSGADVSSLMRYELLRDHARTLTPIAWTNDNLNLTGVGEPAQVPIARVTPNFFSVLGVEPALGRGFADSDGRPESRPVVILSHQLWRTRFNSNPNIIGSNIDLDGTPSTIVGVLPAGVAFPFVGQAGLFSPRYFEITLMPTARLRLGVGYLGLAGRLHPGATAVEANAELAVLNARYLKEYPTAGDAVPTMGMKAQLLQDSVVGDLRGKLWILMAAVGLLLLIGCANVASLLLSRALARRRELAIRSALGASRSAVMRQLLTESLLLAFAAGLCGVLLGWVADRVFVAWAAAQLPQGMPISIDGRVVVFAVAVSILTGVLTGIFPALQLARANLNNTLRDEGRGLSGSRARARLRSMLVIGQVALSLLLLIGAGLLARSFERLLRTDPGFAAGHVLTMEISLPTTKYAKPGQQIGFFREVLRRVSALPGVRSAAISATLPLQFKRITPLLPQGQPVVPLTQRPFIDIEAVSPAWFATMRVPLIAGRTFAEADDAQSPKVVIVNRTFAQRFWPRDNPVGKTILIGRGPGLSQVVGVAGDVHNQGLAEAPQAQVWVPFPQLPWGDMNLLVRTTVAPMSMAAAVHAQVSAVDPDQPVTGIQTVNDLMDADRAQPRFTMLLLGVFAVTALALAAIGLAAMLAWTVMQRRQELAIRLALGASHDDLLQLVIRHGLLLAIWGIAIGWIAGLGLTRLLSSVLYKTSAHDLRTFATAPILFLAIAWLASYLPARRAMRVDPIETLKAE